MDNTNVAPPPPNQTTNGLTTASLALGVASMLGGAMLIIPPILAVIFGHVGLGACRKNPARFKGAGQAIAGLAMGYVSLMLAIVFYSCIVYMSVPMLRHVYVRSQSPVLQPPQFAHDEDMVRFPVIQKDVRQLLEAAQQIAMETGLEQVTVKIAPDGRVLGESLSQYVARVQPGMQIVGGKIMPGKPLAVTFNGTTLHFDENGGLLNRAR